MERSDLFGQLGLPGEAEILRRVLSLPEAAWQSTAEDAVDLFAELHGCLAAFKAAEDWAFYFAHERGVDHKTLGEAARAKAAKAAAQSRLRTLRLRWPEGSDQLLELIRRRYERVSGEAGRPADVEPVVEAAVEDREQ
ncbi:hypothetical protein [Amycolatopsis japonica]|uniref:hypothetical protein n=1 Tax=Amycolatopsis japonica TaxID=208439 RepID=UPI000589CF3C|nr:hypothetical protein [Amycolatopsis japonica]